MRSHPASQRPASWMDLRLEDPALPFAHFFADPTENPTVRPAPAAPTFEPVPGEEGLVIIARRRHP